jgi:hypothetical protein
MVATVALVFGAVGCSADDGGALEDPDVVARLHDLALQAASSDGAGSPTKMYAVAVSDHQVAETALSGAIIFDHAPVYVIVITGGPFTARSAPLGAPLPQGTVLTLTLDAATFEVTDVGIVNVEPDLSGVASDRVDWI